MKRFISSFTLYLFAISFVFAWWYCSFCEEKPPVLTPVSKSKTTLPLLLSPLSRDKLHQALSGDFALMSELICEWDYDAQILESHGFLNTERLARHKFVRALTLSRAIKNQLPRKKEHRFLPQSFSSASFLLALLDPQEIIALPEGFRKRIPLLQPEKLAQIKHDFSPHTKELLYLLKPECVFVMPYSNPGVLQALETQKIPYLCLAGASRLEDIFTQLKAIGEAVARPLEAELLSVFMESALMAIDTRMKLLSPGPTTFYLTFGSRFSYPAENTLTGELLKRMPLHPFNWQTPLTREELLVLRPQRLIVACENRQEVKKLALTHPTVAHLQTPIYFVDESIQASPDQYLVLAYYDIFEALTD